MGSYSNARRALAAFAPLALAISAVSVLALVGPPLAIFAGAIPVVVAIGVLMGGRALLAAVVSRAPYLAGLFILAAAGPALAADGTISIGWGDWTVSAVTALSAAAVPVLLALWRAASFVPPIVKTLLSEQLLTRALDYGLAAVVGAAKGKTLDIPVANEVLRQAAQYAIDNGAPWLLKYIGDLGPKLLARMSAAEVLPVTASAENVKLDPSQLAPR